MIAGNRTLFMDNTGPLIMYVPSDRMLLIENLNPHVRTAWKMSRWEMIKTGLRFVLAGLR